MTATCTSRGLVDAHFVGSITPEEERSMRAHVAICESCRVHYRRRVLLAKLNPAALGPEERIGRGLGLQRGRPRVRPFATAAVAVVLAAAAVLLFFRTDGGAAENGFSSRGAGLPTMPTSTERAPAESRVEVYRIPRSGRPTPAVGSIHRDDELAFAYENGLRKERLVVFGVDEHHRIYWFHPAWVNEGDDPVALAVSREPGLHELTEAVAHDFTGARLDIHAVFIDEAMSVRQIERRLDAGALSVPGAVERVYSFTVLP